MSAREWWPGPGDVVPKKRRPVAMTLLGGASVLIPADRLLSGPMESRGEVEARFAVTRHEECMSLFWRPHAR